MHIKLYLDMRGKAKDGKGSLLLLLSHKGTTASIPMGYRLSPSEWDGSNVINRPDADAINAIVHKKAADINMKIFLQSMSPAFNQKTAAQLKKSVVTKEKTHTERSLLTSLFAEYVKVKKLRSNTVESYKSTINKIIEYAGAGITIQDIDYKWLLDFDNYMAKTQMVNGRAIYLRNLRAVCNYAKRVGIVDTYPFTNYSVKVEPTKKKNICIDKLRELYYYSPEPYQEQYKDLFFLMFFMIGVNSADLFSATPDAIQDGRFVYTRHKTGTYYSIKLEPEALAIIEKYRGEKHLLSPCDRYRTSKEYLSHMNKQLKRIGPYTWEMIPDPDDLFAKPKLHKVITPIVPNISSNFARHTWATIAKKIRIPIDTIAQALGHKDLNHKITWIYIEEDQDQVDIANRKVIDYFLGKG